MPATSRGGKVKTEELPSTLQRSPAKAQRTFAKAHDAAAQQYGDGERAHRTAYAAVKHGFEKVGDHWDVRGRSRMDKGELVDAIQKANAAATRKAR